MLKISRTNSEHPDFHRLVRLLDQDLKEIDGEGHAFFAQFNKIDSIRQVVLAYMADQAVGCGAIKKYSPGTAEVKRMFVLPHHRGQGIASHILQELEQWANELNFKKLILETGQAQPDAIRLYQKNAYKIIPNYGQYAGVASSICMEKAI